MQNDIKQNYTPSRHDHDGNMAYQLSDPPKSTDMNKERKEEKTYVLNQQRIYRTIPEEMKAGLPPMRKDNINRYQSSIVGECDKSNATRRDTSSKRKMTAIDSWIDDLDPTMPVMVKEADQVNIPMQMLIQQRLP